MKHLFNTLIAAILALATHGCCTEELVVGEMVEIPIQFNGFSLSEIEKIMVYRIDKSNTNSIDTFMLSNILWAHKARANNEVITDNTPPHSKKQFGRYESYLHHCHLVFDWQIGKDTFSDFEIKKVKAKVRGCHKDDPNVKIVAFSFVHKGKTIAPGQSVSITK